MNWPTPPSSALYSKFLILFFQDYSSPTSNYLFTMLFCIIYIFTYNFSMCPGYYFGRYWFEKDSSFLAVEGAEVRKTSNKTHKITWNKHYENKEWKAFFYFKIYSCSFDCINLNVLCTEFEGRKGEMEVLFDRWTKW